MHRRAVTKGMRAKVAYLHHDARHGLGQWNSLHHVCGRARVRDGRVSDNRLPVKEGEEGTIVPKV